MLRAITTGSSNVVRKIIRIPTLQGGIYQQ